MVNFTQIGVCAAVLALPRSCCVGDCGVDAVFEVLNSDVILRGIGVVGFLLYVIGFAALQFRLLDGNGVAYCLVNIAAASCVLLSFVVDFNLASSLIQVSWILIGGWGLFIRHKRSCDSQRTAVV